MRKGKSERGKPVLIYQMHFFLILFHSAGMLLLTATTLMFLFLVSAYMVLTLMNTDGKQGSSLVLAIAVWAGLVIALWFIIKRYYKKKKQVEGLIVKVEEREFDEGKAFFIYTVPGDVKSEIPEKAFSKLKKGDRIVLNYLRLVEEVVSISKL